MRDYNIGASNILICMRRAAEGWLWFAYQQDWFTSQVVETTGCYHYSSGCVLVLTRALFSRYCFLLQVTAQRHQRGGMTSVENTTSEWQDRGYCCPTIEAMIVGQKMQILHLNYGMIHRLLLDRHLFV